MDNDDEDIRSAANLREKAEKRILRRFEIAQKFWWLIGLVVFGIVAVTLFVADNRRILSEHDKRIDRNRETDRILWEKVFGYPMPP